MIIEEGCTLKSTTKLNGDYFARAIIYIFQHNHKGSIGFVINKKVRKNIMVHKTKMTIYNGGPITQNSLNILHDAPLQIAGAMHIAQGIYWNNNIDIGYLESLEELPKNIKIFTGYCGWDAQELENEMKNGFWEIIPTSNQLIFTE